MAHEARTWVEYIDIATNSAEEHPVLALPGHRDSQSDFTYYSARSLRRLADNAASVYVDGGLRPRQSGERPLLVALFGYGTIEWAASFFAITRMGHAVFNLSSRLSEDYVARLLVKSDPDVLVHDRPVVLPNEGVVRLPLVEGQLLTSAIKKSLGEITCDPKTIAGSDTVFICHSSGTTSLPKLLPFSNDDWMTRQRTMRLIYRDDKREWAASAMYNIVGLNRLTRSLTKTAPTFFDNDRVNFTTDSIMSFLDEAQLDFISTTPYTLNLIARAKGGIRTLRGYEKVTVFGAVCPDELGDMLSREGIFVLDTYASTETGILLESAKPDRDTAWKWLLPSPPKKAFLDMRPVQGHDNVFELVLLPGCPEVLSAFAAEDGHYYTKDLFLRHPTKPDAWKIIGRKDDEIKVYQRDRQTIVNAIPYEQELMHDNEDLVDDIVLFGQGRGKLGVLAFAAAASPGSVTADLVLSRVWETIERRINGKMTVGINRDMIVPLDVRGKRLPRTWKFNLMRAQIYLRFEDEINLAYERSADAVVDRDRSGAVKEAQL
ncbi:uncharacterized protein HMPREF1541_03484 [Cyphellophora europaea CBS 101466]|uniref:AMP-dependent synthetase/ligase domain-containing protein n=1 Tax=Cyphellophora europaea (strain CBS 101466) TaxID=1220924 RepID=W2S0I4_CYPE1|nr:uncharacterized protein HMPREF1541_03484 [Cyphellophora europaea CBS 101466]ETN41548.1 hypothetical protein HMPREF1541_03484 [Cyphellophora europaea CBS 101466]